ncbi:ECF transporter S component [Clostridium sp.]|uniref:ECF transporter S component n=1 Tax=Clostridium sp. TaxID=1506 RepID=UPI0032168EC0
MKTNLKKMVISSLLIAMSIIIPVIFGPFLKVYIPPFSATLAAHVPMFIAMFLGPFEAAVVGIGSVVGFFFAIPDPIVAMRASSHIVVGYIGAKMIMKKMSYGKVVAFTAPIHGIFEGLVVLIFTGNIILSLVVTGIGTIIHHIVDGIISIPIIRIIQKGLGINLSTIGEKKQEDHKDVAV